MYLRIHISPFHWQHITIKTHRDQQPSVTAAVPSPRAMKMETKIAAWTGNGRRLTALGAAETTVSAKLVLCIDTMTVDDMVVAAVRTTARPAGREESQR